MKFWIRLINTVFGSAPLLNHFDKDSRNLYYVKTIYIVYIFA